MINKKNFIIFLILVSFYVLWAQNDPPQQREAKVEMKEKPTLPSPQALRAKPKTNAPKKVVLPAFQKKFKVRTLGATPSIEGFKSINPPKHLNFKTISGNFAIAYGDVILGKVDPHIKVGLAKTFPIQLWSDLDIAYSIDPKYKTPDKVHEALKYFSEHTNINFYPYEGEAQDSIVFTHNDKYCYSFLGKVGGHQPIMLGPNCGRQEILHEVMHALGFIHEQSRTDRDQYLKINWHNIMPGFEEQFALVPEIFMEPLARSPFNYNSIMMYHEEFFAKAEGLKTMEALDGQKISPETDGLHDEDIRRVNQIYY